MKRIKYIGIVLLLMGVSLIFSRCTSGFTDMNIDPRSEQAVTPERLFYTAQIQTLTSGHCWNGIWASKARWLQYGAGIWGYTNIQYTYFSGAIGNTIYNEYNEMGSYVTDLAYQASLLENKEQYAGLINASRILLIAKGIQTSDLFGSLAYSEAWKAREGKTDPADLMPRYETQEELVEIWDRDLKECIANLKAIDGTPQIALIGHDRAYNGDLKKWIKAANGIRLRIAGRIWNRTPDKALEIAKDVLKPENAADLFSGNDDSFILWFDRLYTNIHGSDWHSSRDMLIATKSMVNYALKNGDPRLRIFYAKNNLTPERVEIYNKSQDESVNKIPVEWANQPFIGGTANRDDWTVEKDRARYSETFNFGTEKIDIMPGNRAQSRVWFGADRISIGNVDHAGSGGNWAPIMSYADFCFLAAEFALRERESVSSNKTAKEWYEAGVRASLDQWNFIGGYSQTLYYESFTPAEIDNFLNQPDVKWDESKALEQIRAQWYVENYKNVDEAYAQWKRTNYPNINGTIITRERVFVGGVETVVPRKVIFTKASSAAHNSKNMNDRLDKMEEDPQFLGIDNEYGRLWWDSPGNE